jgi:hypothetical protein
LDSCTPRQLVRVGATCPSLSHARARAKHTTVPSPATHGMWDLWAMFLSCHELSTPVLGGEAKKKLTALIAIL